MICFLDEFICNKFFLQAIALINIDDPCHSLKHQVFWQIPRARFIQRAFKVHSFTVVAFEIPL